MMRAHFQHLICFTLILALTLGMCGETAVYGNTLDSQKIYSTQTTSQAITQPALWVMHSMRSKSMALLQNVREQSYAILKSRPAQIVAIGVLFSAIPHAENVFENPELSSQHIERLRSYVFLYGGPILTVVLTVYKIVEEKIAARGFLNTSSSYIEALFVTFIKVYSSLLGGLVFVVVAQNILHIPSQLAPIDSPAGLFQDRVTAAFIIMIAAFIFVGVKIYHSRNQRDSSTLVQYEDPDHEQFSSPTPLFAMSFLLGLPAAALWLGPEFEPIGNVARLLGVAALASFGWGIVETIGNVYSKISHQASAKDAAILRDTLAKVLHEDPTFSAQWNPENHVVRLAKPEDGLSWNARARRQGNVIIIHPAYSSNPAVLRHELTHLYKDSPTIATTWSDVVIAWFLGISQELRARWNENPASPIQTFFDAAA